MLSRFEGANNERIVLDALLSQKLIGGNRDLALAFQAKATLHEVKSNEYLIRQGGVDDDIYLVLSGGFEIVVNKTRVARRFANDHVGEMAAIEPSQPRAASVIATETSVVAKISAANLAELGQQYPEVFRCIAKDLAKRLHQRNAHVGAARESIKVFVISSAESLGVARAIQTAFSHDPFVTTVWTDGVFRATGYPLQSLLEAVDDSDFAIAIAHADDSSAYRGQTWPVPRDNVVFELGLFMGRLGRDRAILMEPRDVDVKLPSDLSGVTTIVYRYSPGHDAAALMGPACNQLRDHILRLGPNN